MGWAERSFEAPIWARGGHAQTLLGVWLPSAAPELHAGRDGVVRHDVALEDGDRLVTLEAPPARGVEPSGWVVHLFHGLSGSANSAYVRRATRHFTRRGATVVAVNHRGAGAGAGLARAMYNSGVTTDVAAALRAGRARHPRARHVAIGYSMSGNALLLLLGRERVDLPDGAIAVNPPVALASCVERLERRENRLYDLNFTRQCRRSMTERVKAGLCELEPDVLAFRTVREFDERVTAPRWGFRDAEHYYAECSAAPWLASIETPTFVLASRDDPMIDWRDTAEARRSRAVRVHVAESGGHMGYLLRDARLGYRRWLEEALDVAFERIVAEHAPAIARAAT